MHHKYMSEIESSLAARRIGKKRFNVHKNETSEQFTIGENRSVSPNPVKRDTTPVPIEKMIKRDMTPIPTMATPYSIDQQQEKWSERRHFENRSSSITVEAVKSPVIENFSKPISLREKRPKFNSSLKQDYQNSPDLDIFSKPIISASTQIIENKEVPSDAFLKPLLHQPMFTKKNPRVQDYNPITGYIIKPERNSPERRIGMNDYGKMVLQQQMDRPYFSIS
ncbi:unnamed protein product [Blepharisma stoltei]|uniref:Uncharacterized protein n=1 Tax=Blepharisma stoltei TaxID=1481888 RepID=A0AAU9JPX8_9CILI|nr:unnamed protein product [Blepharisma stoltei]